MAQDIYSRLDEVDDQLLRSIAATLEVRGRHPQQVAMRRAYLDRLGDLATQRILDVGCGTGVATFDLARRAAPGYVVGIDPTPAFIEIADQRRDEQRLDNVTFQVADGRSLRFEDASFDGVAAVTVLSHLPHRAEVLAEMIRVVRPSGWLLIVDGEFAANQIEHPDSETTHRIVDAWRMTTVDDPRLMRRIIPFLEGAGLRTDGVQGHLHVEAGHVDEAKSFIWQWSQFAVRQALGAGAVCEPEAARWTEQLRDLNQRGELYGAVTFLSVVARRADPAR
jgi:ubiquinone/menaquinone biosynthesis C-methylase UbiE